MHRIVIKVLNLILIPRSLLPPLPLAAFAAFASALVLLLRLTFALALAILALRPRHVPVAVAVASWVRLQALRALMPSARIPRAEVP